MKVKGIAAPAPKVRRLSIAAACLAFFLSISEPAYATSNLQISVTIPMTGASLEASIPAPLEEQIDPNPSLLELDSVKTVDASSMALISVAARKVELARQSDGAREVAKEIIATNGTLGVGSEDMQGYFVSSMVNSDIEKDCLKKMIVEGKNPLEVSQFVNEDDGTTLFSRFISKIMEIHNTSQYEDCEKQKQFENANSWTYLFEMVLENRLNPFNGKVHDELAISYCQTDGVMFLARNYYNGNELVSNPFYELKHNFSQPLYWNTTIDELLVMSSDNNKVVTGKMTEEEFMEKHPPTGGSGTFDPEGFVAYFTVENGYGKITKNIYTKVKTDAYYKFHKLHLEELSELLSFPETVVKYFPALGALKKFFDVNVQMKFIEKLVKASTSDEMKDKIQGKAKDSFEKACCELKKLIEKFENEKDVTEKAKLEKLKQSKQKDVSKRILGQKDASETWNQIVLNLINVMFGKVRSDEMMNVGGYLKKLLMEDLKVFDNGYEERLVSMLDCSQVEKDGLSKSFGNIYLAIST